ncbi:MAG TPA: cell division protein ZipA C-terminal FtsZ-binding domain-containing protein [Methylotenera sp.]|nr:cell division protein ZipA C-terminal FtsZ-binding domain-containing protein [Methylotenera sp.]HPN01051.1 cell division protein ZipA C-terminal FtsZ-binding domain-containing protein [Methylotenera sp.]
MTNLYVLLIAMGVLIIASVFAYNWWQERKYYQQAEKNFTPLQSDALLDDPNLDVNKVKDAFEDTIIDPFSSKIKISQTESVDTNPSSESNEKSVEEFLPDDVSINEAYAQLTKARAASQVNQRIADAPPAPRSEDIKAIFDDVFGHKNKTANEPHLTESPKQAEPKILHTPAVSQPSDQVHASANNATSDQNIANNTAEIDTSDESKASDESKVIELALPSMLHRQMDYTAILHLSREIPASTIVNTLIGQFEGYDKPVFVHTLTSNALELAEDVAPLWTLLKEVSPHQKVSKIACSIQLADRSGAISRNLLNRFQLAVSELNKQLNAQLAWQETGDILSKANALDAFCIEVDKTIGFHLVHGEQGAFTGTKLKGLAEAQGFRLSSDGSFKYFDESGRPIFIMFNRENFRFNVEMLRNSVIKGITFQLDIPHIAENGHAFSQMVQVAKQMNIGLNAILVDEGNKVLGDAQLEKISQQLKAIHSNMLTRGIVPGSESAVRLFS